MRTRKFLWCWAFIRPCTIFLAATGTIAFFVRDFFDKKILLKAKEQPDPAKVVASIVLETCMSIHYSCTSNGNEAAFFYEDFPFVDQNGDPHCADLFAVYIDLKTKTMTKANIDGSTLSASQAMTLCIWLLVGPMHVKLHSYANWAVNTDSAVKDINPFYHRNSITTVFYNYMGFSGFCSLIPFFAKLGIVHPNWNKHNNGNALMYCFRKGIESGVCQHPQIKELVLYSRYVSFVVKARAIFSSEFNKHEELFPGAHCEALFIGTVLHSLDHSNLTEIVDPIWLDREDPKYGVMASLVPIVQSGFAKDVPGIYFHKQFKGSGHPFYEAVYQKCAKIDKLFADDMDSCIIK